MNSLRVFSHKESKKLSKSKYLMTYDEYNTLPDKNKLKLDSLRTRINHLQSQLNNMKKVKTKKKNKDKSHEKKSIMNIYKYIGMQNNLNNKNKTFFHIKTINNTLSKDKIQNKENKIKKINITNKNQVKNHIIKKTKLANKNYKMIENSKRSSKHSTIMDKTLSNNISSLEKDLKLLQRKEEEYEKLIKQTKLSKQYFSEKNETRNKSADRYSTNKGRQNKLNIKENLRNHELKSNNKEVKRKFHRSLDLTPKNLINCSNKNEKIYRKSLYISGQNSCNNKNIYPNKIRFRSIVLDKYFDDKK